MSWLSEFTSKAENLLTKFDQTAAQTFNDSNTDNSNILQQHGQTNHPTAHDSPKEYKNASQLFQNVPQKPKEHHQVGSNAGKILPKAATTTSTIPSMTRSSSSPSLKKEEDMLFEFLNSNPNQISSSVKGHVRNLSGGPKTSTPRKPLITNTPPPTKTELASQQQQQEEQQLQKVLSAKDDVIKQSSEKEKVSDATNKESDSSKAPPDSTGIDAVDAALVPPTQPRPPTVSGVTKITDNRLSNLELENKLLKNELQSLHEELATLSSKLKQQQEETDKYRLRYENRRSQQNEDYERVRKDFESRESDLNEALKAKDSQLAVLRVRIQETDAELEVKKKILIELQDQNEQLLKDHSEATGVQGTVMSNLRQKLEELENELKKEKLESSSMKNEMMTLQTKLETEKHQYSESIRDLQSKQTQGKDRTRELEIKIKVAEDSAGNALKELKDYKDKAARILQAKEKLIASLRQGSGGSSEISPGLMSELEEMRQERDLLRDEAQQNKYKMEQLRSEYLDLDILHKNETDDYQEKIETLQTSLQDEIQKRQTAEEDMKRYIQELHFSREEMHSLKKTQISRNQEYEANIKRLQSQLNAKQTVTSSQEELENRIRTLTDSLIHKQTVVEALSTEKNSLNLQLERLERQYKDIQNSLIKRSKTSSNDIEEGEGESKLHSISSIMPQQISRNVRWRTTVNEIDKFSIRLGVFLRRYPIARLMVIFYMLLLHLWVTFVILTYTPEIHDHEFKPK